MARIVVEKSAALHALLAGAIDYAGCFPPASLALSEAARNYLAYRNGPFAWMLGRFVVRTQDVDQLPPDWDGSIAVVGEDHPRASAVETQRAAHFDKPTYCEVPRESLEAVQNAGSFAKLRTGGLTPSAIPQTQQIAGFLIECARLRLPFKATAGLHHPIRGQGGMHGFINVLFAACWLWSDGDPALLTEILEGTDPAVFQFNDAASWRGHTLSVNQIEAARRDFMHSFGSCSITEPIADLEALGWL